jgi:ketosteroid isomerase-like protein
MAVATDNTTVVREGYERFMAQDVEGVLALFSPELVWEIPGPQALAGEYRGPDGAAEFFTKLPQYWESIEVRPLEFLADGERVVAIGRHLIGRNGRKYDIPFVHVWTVRDGRVTSFREYTDTALFERMLAE